LAPSSALALALVALALLHLARGEALAARRAKEYDLKATFLFHFTHFVDWPAEAFPDAEAPFRICVLEPDPFQGVLGEIVAGERAAGRAVEAHAVETASAARGCQIVFVPRGRDSAVVADLPGVEGGLVLTVGERADFLEHGGIVRFELSEGRLRLVVSRRALGKSKLALSSKLLALAHLE
jgi:hypothetical protein